MIIRRELIDELLKEYEIPQDILSEGGLLKELTKAVIERCLEGTDRQNPGAVCTRDDHARHSGAIARTGCAWTSIFPISQAILLWIVERHPLLSLEYPILPQVE
jgi:hypothetical protein